MANMEVESIISTFFLDLNIRLDIFRYTVEVDEDTQYFCVVRVMEGFYDQSDIEVKAVDPAHFNLLLNDNEALLSTTFQVSTKTEKKVRTSDVICNCILTYTCHYRFRNQCASPLLTTSRREKEPSTKKHVSKCLTNQMRAGIT